MSTIAVTTEDPLMENAKNKTNDTKDKEGTDSFEHKADKNMNTVKTKP